MRLELGDCLEVLKTIPDNSVDSIVTDPPYGLSFMNKEWDSPEKLKKNLEHHKNKTDERGKAGFSPLPFERYGGKKEGQWFQEWCEEWGKECLRVLKPGGHMLSFSAPRMYHRMTTGLEDAGFEIRDQIMWVFGSGFPKSRNMGNGWGTALKPAHEPIVVARKPISEKTVAENILKWGTGGLNIDESRIEYKDDKPSLKVINQGNDLTGWGVELDKGRLEDWEPNNTGRWPANIILDEEAGQILDEQSGISKSTPDKRTTKTPTGQMFGTGKITSHNDKGGASRFFYCPKTSKKDRDKDNIHPTVKPTSLMEYLIKLVTPVNGTVMDCFLGSGSTGKAAVRGGFDFIGIEKEEEYIKIAESRINNA